MKIDKEKNFIQIGLTIIMGCICFVALAFYLQKVSLTNLVDSVEVGKENGFNLLDFSSDFMSASYSWGATLLGFLCLLQILISITTIILSVCSIFFFKKNTTYILNTVFFFLCFSFLFLYMLEGFLFNKIYIDSGGYYYKGSFIDGVADYFSVNISVKTLSYLPFIFGIILLIMYVISEILRKKNISIFKQRVNTNIDHDKNIEKDINTYVKNDIEILETLKKYKELLDLNIITKEEFDERKNKLLSE